MRKFLIKVIFAVGSVGSVGLSIFLVFQVIGWMGDKFQENAKQVQEKAQADVARTTKQAEVNQAQIEAEKQAAKEQARQLELTKFKDEIAQNQAEESKKNEFESQFKPRPECNDPNLEWSKFVQCKNEKITAKEKFYSTH